MRKQRHRRPRRAVVRVAVAAGTGDRVPGIVAGHAERTTGLQLIATWFAAISPFLEIAARQVGRFHAWLVFRQPAALQDHPLPFWLVLLLWGTVALLAAVGTRLSQAREQLQL